ncbi:MAG: flagellar filament capping protein FliD [Bryobacteraceae bacterium]
MGTSSTSPSSAASQAASIATPIYFTGLSSFSSDFQSIIQRAVQIADIPVTNLQNEQATNTAEENALTALEPTVNALGTDVANLGSLASSQGLAASSSDSSTVSVVNTGATAPATYTVSDITSLASAASETSLQGYAATDSVSASGLVNLVIGSTTYQLNLTGSGENNISGLAQAINNAGAGVSATVLTSGSTGYLSVSANNTGATTLQLNSVTPVDLVTSNGTGTESSLQTYADETSAPVSASGQVQLVVGTQDYTLDVSSNNNLDGLVQAINSADAGVTASVTGNAGSYSLSLNSPSGPATIQLNDLQSPVDLITSSNQGSNATFSLSGIPNPITESSNTITDVIPGVSFTLLNTLPSGSVTMSLATDPSQLSSALQTFVTDYNTLVTAVEAQQGQNAGPLQGDLIINEISSDMQSLVTYWNPTSGSSIQSLSDLGVTFDDTGQMSFDTSTFNALSDTNISDAFKFLGSASTGFAALASNFTQLTDPITGLIQAQIDGYQTENTDLGNEITTAQAQAAAVQASATSQAEAADALVAQLEQQQTDLDASIQSVNYVLYGRQVGADGI